MFKLKLKHLLIAAIFAVSIFGLKQNVCAETMEINESNFPDEGLRFGLEEAVRESLGGDYDDFLYYGFHSSAVGTYSADTGKYTINTENVTSLFIPHLSDTTGLYRFTELTSLNISSEENISINFNIFTKLENLSINVNFTTIDLKDLNNLKELYLNTPNCTSLTLGDVSKVETLKLHNFHSDIINSFTGLKNLQVEYSSISAASLADVLSNLESLKINESNSFSSLDLSIGTNLKDISISSCNITSLDVSGCINAETIYIGNTDLSSLDISNNTKLTTLKTCSNEKLSDITIGKITKLEDIDIYNSPIKELSISKLSNLGCLEFSYTQISSLDISNNTKLETLNAYTNKKLTKINIGKNTKLDLISIYNSPIKELSISKLSNLKFLEVCKTKISSLDISNNTKLKTLYANANKKLTKINIGKNTKLYDINISSSPVKKLSTSKLKNLEYLNVSNTKIKKLNLKSQKNLSITFENVKKGSTINLSKFIGTGYKMDSDAKKYYKLSYNSKTGKLKTSKKAGDAYATFKKGKRTYYISILFK